MIRISFTDGGSCERHGEIRGRGREGLEGKGVKGGEEKKFAEESEKVKESWREEERGRGRGGLKEKRIPKKCG